MAASTASFTFTSNEAGSGFSCSLDGAAFTDCSPPRDYTGVAVGAHTFAVRAPDPAGNLDPSPARRTWTVVTSLPGTNLAPDSGFEQDPAGSYGTNGAATFTWATDAVHGGVRSLKIASTTDGLARWLSDLSPIAVTPGATYHASVWAKTQDLTGSAYLSVNFWTAAGVYIPATVDSRVHLSGSHDWTELSLQAIAPAGATRARIELRQVGPGTSWFDDADVQRR